MIVDKNSRDHLGRPRDVASAAIDEARCLVGEFVEHYNNERLHSAIGYVTPADKMNGRENDIRLLGDRRLEAARQRRAEARRHARASAPSPA